MASQRPVALGLILGGLLLSSCTQNGHGEPLQDFKATPAEHPMTTAPGESDDSITMPVRSGEPCFHAERWSVREVADRADTPVSLPVPSSPDTANLTVAWICGANTAVMTFDDIRVFYEPGWSDVDVDEKWAVLAHDYGGSVETILDRPGLVQPLTDDAERPPVMVVNGDVLIRLLGEPSSSIGEMVTLADSLDLRNPVS